MEQRWSRLLGIFTKSNSNSTKMNSVKASQMNRVGLTIYEERKDVQ